MKVVLDISPLKTAHKARGIGVYTSQLSQALKKVDQTNHYILTSRPRDIKGVDLVHYPYFDLFFRSLPLKKTTPIVVTIHDVIPLIFPHHFRPGLRGKISFYFQRLSLNQVEAIITDSNNSKTDIINYLNIPSAKIHVIPLAAASAFSRPLSSNQLQKIKSKYHLPDKYLLYVGDINYHKNLPRLIQAFKLTLANYPQLTLVLVSRALSQPIPEAKAIKTLIVELKLESQVKILTTVPLDPVNHLNGLYKLSHAYIHPSLYEGFGLPVLEAMTVGTSVVCSTSASLPEVYGSAAISVNPNRVDSISTGLKTVLELTEPERKNLIKKGKAQAAKFSWEQTARQTISVYEAII